MVMPRIMYQINMLMLIINNDIVIEDPLAREVVHELNIPIRRPTRQRVPSHHYSPNEYVLLSDCEEHECYE